MITTSLPAYPVVFPADSCESKLAARPVTKIPQLTDWAHQDFFNLAHEATYVPLDSLTDIDKLTAVDLEHDVDYRLDMGSFLLPTLDTKPTHSPFARPLPSPAKEPVNSKKTLRDALQGALDLVEKSMDDTLQGYSEPRDWNDLCSWCDDLAESVPDLAWDSGYESGSDVQASRAVPTKASLPTLSVDNEIPPSSRSSDSEPTTPTEQDASSSSPTPQQKWISKLKHKVSISMAPHIKPRHLPMPTAAKLVHRLRRWFDRPSH